jgi:hypothetical protein
MSGNTICRYVVEARYAGKDVFIVGTFTTPRLKTEQETEAAALSDAKAAIDGFWERHFPDGSHRPEPVRAILGSAVFVPDDYEWRRT